MKKKKRGIIIFSTVFIFLLISVLLAAPFIKARLDLSAVQKYQATDLKNVDSIMLISHCAEIDGFTNTVSGVTEAIKLGADAVVVDLCFRANGTPVMTDNYENNANAPTVESLFLTLSAEQYKNIKIYFNIVQFTTLDEFNSLAIEYGMVDRISLIGIDEMRYGLVNSDSTIIPFLLKYKITDEDKASIENGTFSAPECISEYGAAGLEIDAEDATPQVIEALNDFGIPFIVSGVDSTRKFCTLLSDGASSVYVKDIKSCSETLDRWIEAMQERYKSSVEQSLQDLRNEQIGTS